VIEPLLQRALDLKSKGASQTAFIILANVCGRMSVKENQSAQLRLRARDPRRRECLNDQQIVLRLSSRASFRIVRRPAATTERWGDVASFCRGLCVEDNMERRDQELLNRQMKRFQPSPPRDTVMISCDSRRLPSRPHRRQLIFSGQPPAQTTSSDGKTALAFLLNGTSNTKP
jgi:hypothetical protein